MKKRSKILSIILTCVMVAGLSACGSSTTSTATASTAVSSTGTASAATASSAQVESAATSSTLATAASGGTLKVALTNPFTGAGCYNTANPYRYAALQQVYETMLEKDGDKYVGILAKEWVNKGNGVWDITLYDGITDSEGNKFTSKDVQFGLAKLKEAQHNAAVYYSDDCIQIADDTHFTLTLNTDSEGAFYFVAANCMLTTQAAYEGSKDNLATDPIGTGPYICSSYVEGNSCILKKRTDYWKAEDIPDPSAANFDEIDISFVSEATQMSVAITGGTVQFAGQVDMSLSDQVGSTGSVKTDYVSNGTYNGLAFNMNGREVSTNLKLRQAICEAIDISGLAAGVYGGHASELTTYGIPTAIDFDKSWTKDLGYDAEKAVSDLKASGFDTSKNIVLLANNVGEDSQIAELIQGYLAAAGINCKLDNVDPATQQTEIAKGEWDICLAGGAGVLDMSLFWSNLYAKKDNGMSKYFVSDANLYNVYDAFMAAGGKTSDNLQKIYEWELANVSWYPMFCKQVLYTYADGYSGCFYKDTWMSLPYLGTIKKG